MSEPQRQNIETRLADLEATERASIDRTDRVIERVNRLESRMDARFTALEGKIDNGLAQLQAELHIIVDMFRTQASQIASMQQLLNDRLPPKNS